MAVEGSLPCYKPLIPRRGIDQLIAVIDSGWLTTGLKTLQFEAAIANDVGGRMPSASGSAHC